MLALEGKTMAMTIISTSVFKDYIFVFLFFYIIWFFFLVFTYLLFTFVVLFAFVSLSSMNAKMKIKQNSYHCLFNSWLHQKWKWQNQNEKKGMEDPKICISALGCKKSRWRNWDGYAIWFRSYFKFEDI